MDAANNKSQDKKKGDLKGKDSDEIHQMAEAVREEKAGDKKDENQDKAQDSDKNPVDRAEAVINMGAATVQEKEHKAKKEHKNPENKFRLGNPYKTFLACWEEFVAEFIGTCFLLFFGTGSVILMNQEGFSIPTIFGIAFVFGLAIACIVWSISGISHGHINPAVTLAILVLKNISVSKAAFYMLSQISGALAGSALVLAFFPHAIGRPTAFGATQLAANRTNPYNPDDPWSMGIGQGFFIEVFITGFFVFVVLMSAKVSKNDPLSVGKFAPLAIGFAAFCAHMIGVSLTGCSINPARSFAPAVVSGVWTAHYIYWFGPFTGAVIAALVYKYIFHSPNDEHELAKFGY